MIRVPAIYFTDKAQQINGNADNEAWIADCGSNRHTTNDIRDYVYGSIKQIHIEVHVGDGITVVHKMGDIMLKDAKTGEYVRLRDVLFLPDCSKKLISESLMDQADYRQVKPGNGECNVVCNANNRILMSAKLQPDGLYEFTQLFVVSNDSYGPLSDYRSTANMVQSAVCSYGPETNELPNDLFHSPLSKRKRAREDTATCAISAIHATMPPCQSRGKTGLLLCTR